MISSALVRAFGWPAPLLHGDTAVLDRWLWLRKRLPRVNGTERVIDIGCGSGAFTIGTALRGYRALGLSWDVRNQAVASERARMCGAVSAQFEIQDVRRLHERKDLIEGFDVAILCEVVEHIIDDAKLIRDTAGCLKPGGRLLLTTPNLDLKPIHPTHEGPFPTIEDGGHVRKGYSEPDLLRLCDQAGLIADSFSYCTGVVSQKITQVYFKLSKIHPLVGWGLVSPLRLLPPLVDEGITKLSQYPKYSICLEARKPRPATQLMKPLANEV